MKFSSFLLPLVVLVSCSQKKQVEQNVPKKVKGDWLVSTPRKEGFSQQQLQKVVAEAQKNNTKLDALLIARNGKLIVEEYFNGYNSKKPHKIWSITKMITGTTLGIAVDKGLLSEKDSIHKHLGMYTTNNLTKTGITVEHLITMTSGIKWQEMGGRKSAGFQLPYSDDWIKFVLKQPIANAPGEVFNYSTGNSLLLAPMLKNTTGKQANEFAHENLFAPLGINNYTWYTQSEFWTKQEGGEIPNIQKPDIEYDESFAGLTNTGSGLLMLPRDICKLGQLYLDSGKWDGKQVISKSWVAKSIQPLFNNKNYGYHWRLGTFESYPYYYATGFGLQRVFVFPTLSLVIVTMQQHYTTMPDGQRLTEKMLKAIINSIKTKKVNSI
jgi:CubicO group peptidase (beta-lactamase class C family)